MLCRPSAFPVLLAVSLFIAACGSTTATTEGGRPARREADLITAEEIGRGGYTNAHEVILALRPSWLRERPSVTFGPPDVIIVYVDNVKWGEVSKLGEVPVIGIESILRVSPVDATQLWGPGHAGGVIWIRTARQ